MGYASPPQATDYTGAAIIPTAMCSWGLKPLDATDDLARYRKLCWILASHNLLPAALQFTRTCRDAPQHYHVQVGGQGSSCGLLRSRLAGQYAWDWSCGVIRMALAATAVPQPADLVAAPPRSLRPPRTMGAHLQEPCSSCRAPICECSLAQGLPSTSRTRRR